MCAESKFKIKDVSYEIYGGYFGANFTKVIPDINGNFSVTDYYARYTKRIDNDKAKDKRKFDILKKELNQYTKAELIKGFHEMLENFEEN